jgi:hypothetical protein
MTKWMAAALRNGENNLVHFCDGIISQGEHLEKLASDYFFEVINKVILMIKTAKCTMKDVKVESGSNKQYWVVTWHRSDHAEGEMYDNLESAKTKY